jgi:hypothetical protein
MSRPSRSTLGDASEGKSKSDHVFREWTKNIKPIIAMFEFLSFYSRSTDPESCELLWRQVVPVVRHVFRLKSRTFECDYSKCSASTFLTGRPNQPFIHNLLRSHSETLSYPSFSVCCMHTVCTVNGVGMFAFSWQCCRPISV